MTSLSDDLAHDGHPLACRPRRVSVGVQALHTVELALPTMDDIFVSVVGGNGSTARAAD